MLKVTLDTMVIWDWLKDRQIPDAMLRLLALKEAGRIELAVTATIRQDVYYSPMAVKLDALPEIGVEEVRGVARIGTWMLGRDLLADEGFAEWSEQLEKPGTEDLDHLSRPHAPRRDYFLTTDHEILDLTDELSQRWGIEVRTPDQFLTDHG